MPALIATLAQIGALILKELLAIIKEPSSRVILFAPALMQALLFGYGATRPEPRALRGAGPEP